MGSDAGLGALTLGWKIRPREVPTAWVVQERLCPEDDAPREAPPPTVHNTVVSFGSGQFYTDSGRPTGAHSEPSSRRGKAAQARLPRLIRAGFWADQDFQLVLQIHYTRIKMMQESACSPVRSTVPPTKPDIGKDGVASSINLFGSLSPS